ncbi:hypothetical protein ACROYT_G039425 [Oculina patagonica]
MASILAKILDGEITLKDLADPRQIHRNEDVKSEDETFKKHDIAELVPFLLNYLREKTSHHFTPRQNAALTPKKTPVSQAKGSSSTSEQKQNATKNSSRGNLFPSQKTPSPSPVTPLSQSRREKLHEHHSSPSSSPRFRRKSPKVQGNDRDRLSPLVTQPKLNIDDPDDFPPMGSTSKQVTPSRRITPTQVKSDGKKGKSSPAFTSSPFASPNPLLESHGSPASLQEERNMLKLMKSKRKNKGDSPWGNRTSPSPQSGIRSPPLHVLGDFIVSPPKQPTTLDAWQHGHSKLNDSLLSTPSPYKNSSVKNSTGTSSTNNVSSQQFQEQTQQEKVQFLQVDKDKVVFHDKLDALAKVYSKCILENLVPNVTAELYFVVQLLTARGIAPESQQDEETGKADNGNVLGSIHNCAYFAVTILQEIQRLILLLDKETLRLLAESPRIADFSPSLKETFLQQYRTYSVTKESQLNFIKSPLGGVPFSVERDNKQNFPTDRAFHNFRKQRNVWTSSQGKKISNIDENINISLSKIAFLNLRC